MNSQWRDQKNNYQVRKVLGIFCHLTTLVLGQHSVKGLRVHKDIKETKFEGVCNKSELKKKVSRENNSQNTWD